MRLRRVCLPMSCASFELRESPGTFSSAFNRKRHADTVRVLGVSDVACGCRCHRCHDARQPSRRLKASQARGSAGQTSQDQRQFPCQSLESLGHQQALSKHSLDNRNLLGIRDMGQLSAVAHSK